MFVSQRGGGGGVGDERSCGEGWWGVRSLLAGFSRVGPNGLKLEGTTVNYTVLFSFFFVSVQSGIKGRRIHQRGSQHKGSDVTQGNPVNSTTTFLL